MVAIARHTIVGETAEADDQREQAEGAERRAPGTLDPLFQMVQGDARRLPLEDGSVDLVVTSPPYWRKRDYGLPDQIGQESTPELYVDALVGALREWSRVLRPTGSVFLNLGDTYFKRSLVGVPGLLEAAARKDGWLLRNRIVWAKTGGMPDPARDRLASRHEYILHLTRGYSRANDEWHLDSLPSRLKRSGNVRDIRDARRDELAHFGLAHPTPARPPPLSPRCQCPCLLVF